MSKYTRTLLEFSRQHRPQAFAHIADPERFFAEQGRQIEAQVAAVCDELLGDSRPGESPEEFRIRSSQASETAEELVLADCWLMVPEPEPEQDLTQHEDPEIAEYYQDLAEINALADTSDW